MSLQFTLRNWLWLVVIIALAVLWRMDRQQLAVRLSTTERMMQQQKAAFDSTVKRLEAAIVALQTTNHAVIAKTRSDSDFLNRPRVPASLGDPPLPLPEPRPPKPHEQPDLTRNGISQHQLREWVVDVIRYTGGH